MALNTLALRKLNKPGRYADGGRSGLYLKIGPTGGRSWQFRYRRGGKTVWLGLGAEPDVSLAAAREKARECRQLLASRRDPLRERRQREAEEAAKAAALSFRAVAELYVSAHEASWRNAKHRGQWHATLRDYVLPVIGALPVADIDTGAVMRVLEPMWRTTTETASRVRGRIESVLDYARARGWRTGENPARWKGHLANLLPARGKVQRVQHLAALPWCQMGAFMSELARQQGAIAAALRFAIFAASRSSEVRGARWTEIDLAQRVWTIPADRMKAGREHRVPLSDAALDVLHEMEALRRHDSDFVFPGARAGKPLCDRGLTTALRRMGLGEITAHGFRSTFRDWAGETTAFPREVIEMALAHRLGDAAEQAYARGDLFQKRRLLMQEWAEFCSRSAPAGEVVPLRAA
jgi:integrase